MVQLVLSLPMCNLTGYWHDWMRGTQDEAHSTLSCQHTLIAGTQGMRTTMLLSLLNPAPSY